MDFSKIDELREYPFIKAFLSGRVSQSTFIQDLIVFLKDPNFRTHFGFNGDTIKLQELKTLENVLRFPKFTKVLKYNVLLTRNLLLSSRSGCFVDVLDFSTTLSGTHKYAKAIAVLSLPKVQAAKRLFVISAGNYAFSLIESMKRLGIDKELVIVLDKSTESSLVKKLKHKNVKFIYRRLSERKFSSKEIILSSIPSSERQSAEVFTENVDVTNFYQITVRHPMALHNYPEARVKILYKDVVQELGEYDYIICPVGSGELMYAFWNEYKESPSISRKRLPNFIGIVPYNAHPLGEIASYLHTGSLETKAKALATKYFEMENIWGFSNIDWWSADNKEFINANKLAGHAGINSEISGSSGLVFMDENIRNEHKIILKPTDRVLIVNTGNGGILE